METGARSDTSGDEFLVTPAFVYFLLDPLISRQFVFLQLSVLLTIQPAISLGFNRCLCHLSLPEISGVCRWKQRHPLLSASDINSDSNVLYLPFSVCFAQDLCLTLHALVFLSSLGVFDDFRIELLFLLLGLCPRLLLWPSFSIQ